MVFLKNKTKINIFLLYFNVYFLIYRNITITVNLKKVYLTCKKFQIMYKLL